MSFSDEEKEQLRKFNNRSHLLDKASRRQAWLSLVDVLLAYCYDARSTDGEHNVSAKRRPLSPEPHLAAATADDKAPGSLNPSDPLPFHSGP